MHRLSLILGFSVDLWTQKKSIGLLRGCRVVVVGDEEKGREIVKVNIMKKITLKILASIGSNKKVGK